MTKKKRTAALLLAAVLVLASAACGKSENIESRTESQSGTAAAETDAGPQTAESGKEETGADPAGSVPAETPEQPAAEPRENDLAGLKVKIKDPFDGKAAGYTFRVGVGREVITPKIGQPLAGYSPARNSESLHDDLHVICHAFEQDGLVMLTFSLDLCSCGDADSAIVNLTSMMLGVPVANIHVATTHTHSGPSTGDSSYVNTVLAPAALRAATAALEGLQWAEMGVATVQSQVGINRREYNSRSRTVILGQDPEGPYDPTMTVISFRNYEGKCISNIIHYGAHNTASGKNTEITRDWCGVMKDAVEELSGGITAFYNGAQGDVGPRLASGKTTGTLKEALAHGEIAARDAAACWNAITEWKRDCELKQLKGTISIPYAKMDAKMIREEMDDLLDQGTLDKNEQYKYDGLKDALRILESGRAFDSFKLNIRFFALGDAAFVPSPFETFSEMILDIREGSPYPYTLVISNSNGHLGYFPTEKEIPRGGYEIRYYWKRTTERNTPWFVTDGTEYFTADALAILEKMNKLIYE